MSVDDPANVRSVLEEAFGHPGPALVEAMVDPNEPILPGHVTTAQAWNFGKALLRGQKDGWEVVKTLAKDRIREVI